MILLRLTQSFYGREDTALTDRLLGELPGILSWAVDGWRRLRERGRFQQPTAADEMVDELTDLGSPIGAFLRDCCNVGSEYEVQRGSLYEAYAAWAKEHGRMRCGRRSGIWPRRCGRPCLPFAIRGIELRAKLPDSTAEWG